MATHTGRASAGDTQSGARVIAGAGVHACAALLSRLFLNASASTRRVRVLALLPGLLFMGQFDALEESVNVPDAN